MTAVQNPLTPLTDDVTAVDRVLSRQTGSVLLAGHSHGEVVVTEAGEAPNVAGLVYVTAFLPGASESSAAALTEGADPAPLQPPAGGFLSSTPSSFRKVFAYDLPAAQGAFLAAPQVPAAAAVPGEPVPNAAWRSKPNWYVLATEDRIIPPAARSQMAERANTGITGVRGSHAPCISQPEAVAGAIDAAARGLEADEVRL